ncbi:MAG TPA: VIT1/CCC1 transporter family protein [Chloroflexia bacterium]|nr:VIT1/CCC1 transporter family protein [Chloroflexia bacterium]
MSLSPDFDAAQYKKQAAAEADEKEQIEHIQNEKDRVARLGRIRQIVFGSLDGLLVPLGVISGVAGGTANTKAVIIAGLAEAFAGALSMGAGEFISGKSEAQVQQAEVADELHQLKTNPKKEFKEFVLILENEGVKSEDAKVIAQYLHKYPQSYAKTMIEKELGLDMEPETVKLGESLTMGLSYILASIVPLIAYFFLPVEAAFPVSLGLSFVFLVALGFLRGNLARTNILISSLEIVLVGTVSGLGGYILGNWLPKLFGL